MRQTCQMGHHGDVGAVTHAGEYFKARHAAIIQVTQCELHSAARGRALRARSTWGGRCAAPATGRAPRACAARTSGAWGCARRGARLASARLPPRHRRRRMAAGRPRRELEARTAAATRRALGRVAARGAGSRMSAKGASCAREEPRCARTARHLTAADGGPRPAALPLVRGPLGGRRGLRFRPLRGSPPRRAPFERLFRRGES